MISKSTTDQSLSEVHGSIDTTKKLVGWRRIFAFLGPAYLVSVGYMDPGNWATDLAGGARFGYALIWVLLMSNLMALLLQSLSARLGIVRGRDLAQANREAYPKPVNFLLWLLAEIAIAAMDLAEVLGMAIGIQLLTGLPLIWGVTITVLDTFLLLYLQRLGMRKMEAFIISLVAIVAGCFLIQMIMAQPPLGQVVKGFVPSLPGPDALYIAIGIIGATVMPHNLYLHSALVQTRKIDRTDKGIKQALKFNFIDSTIALNIAFLVNAAILVLAATVFFNNGLSHVAEIKEAHQLLPGFLGDLAPTLFAIALIAAGQSSTITGTLAGQIVMEGYLRLRINPILRRLITRLVAIIPAFFVILFTGEENVDELLVLSQVILSMQLAFAVIPLIHFVSNKSTMGKFTIKPLTRTFAWLIATILVYLNIRMLIEEFTPVFQAPELWPKILIIFVGVVFTYLLVFIIIQPFWMKNKLKATQPIHSPANVLSEFSIPAYKKIAIALDFTKYDQKLIESAVGQGKEDTSYLLIHVVESASARLLGNETADFEAVNDKRQLNSYIEQLTGMGLQVEGALGYKNRASEIVRLVKQYGADLLVIGAHGHTGFKDFVYGQTVNTVRHELKVPVLVVNL
jgi:manganese transport protein